MHEERILNQQSVMFSSDQKVKKVKIPFLASKPGIGKYRVEIRAQTGLRKTTVKIYYSKSFQIQSEKYYSYKVSLVKSIFP